MGFIISQDGLHPVPLKVEAIEQMQILANKQDMQDFLRMIGYYCCFIPNFASLDNPFFSFFKMKRNYSGAQRANLVVNNGIHHVLILPLLGHFEEKSLAFAFDSQNELASASGNMIVWFPDSAQLTRPTHACGK
ncbi:hypothetical protein DSO57_1018245 [Entomophthora muscae]|uniref:Uncharacterized protein n=1 Tax=Entomophthora muscae TaxID=34485 RepID=A0ACC2SH10_9FUNG|nr:hypothetical protein DSO57_1018245 [Entomophthora muscae]